MQTIHQILTRYWGYTHFRSLQEEIITSVLDGNDTLALMPTGGGKSICYQVPALHMEGICLVISPLIALMKDQVDALNEKGIKAIAINSLMNWREVETAIENCVYGDYKFLYVSPERLTMDSFRNQLERMSVNLIAVDEAHCISQWGYDFRPPYLKIAEIRELFPEVPVLALTATATPHVVQDIQDKLAFRKPNVLSKSFERKNLAYVVLQEEDKYKRLLKVVTNVRGSGIVYVRSRRMTSEISAFLRKHNINADYYHAGLDAQERAQKQNDWMNSNSAVMVCTNAFGMGIDKPNVRYVVHVDVPDSLEAYFQEAGRAGRDGEKSYAVLLTNKSDQLDFERRVEFSFPAKDEIKKVYRALANHFHVAYGAGEGVFHSLDIQEFCHDFNFTPAIAYNSIKFLEREGYLITTEAFDIPSRVMITANKEELYKMQVQNKALDNFIKLLLRSYPGLFDNYIKINEIDIAKRAQTSVDMVVKSLDRLHKLEILDYIPKTGLPQISFTRGRLPDNELTISAQNYDQRKAITVERMQAVTNYISTNDTCRSQMLLEYFGEKTESRCGQCDVCLERNKLDLNDLQYEELEQLIKEKLWEKPLTVDELMQDIDWQHEEKVLKMIQLLVDKGLLVYNDEGQLINIG